MNPFDELHHQMKHAAAQQAGGVAQSYFVYGHIASYDPAKHRVRVIIPSLRTEGGTPVLSPWMKLGSTWVGSGFGFQWAPHGGASFANPTAGELVRVEIAQRGQGVSAAAYPLFTDIMPPPGGLQPGEAVLKHESGSLLKFNTTGDITLTSARDVNVTAGRDLNATVTRNLLATVTGTVTVNAVGIVKVISAGAVQVVAPTIALCAALTDALRQLVTAAFITLYNGHTHGNVAAGVSHSGPPDQPAGAAQLTNVVTAE